MQVQMPSQPIYIYIYIYDVKAERRVWFNSHIKKDRAEPTGSAKVSIQWTLAFTTVKAQGF